jgi:hypothetical protein
VVGLGAKSVQRLARLVNLNVFAGNKRYLLVSVHPTYCYLMSAAPGSPGGRVRVRVGVRVRVRVGVKVRVGVGVRARVGVGVRLRPTWVGWWVGGAAGVVCWPKAWRLMKRHLGSRDRMASVPLPWWTSKSMTHTFGQGRRVVRGAWCVVRGAWRVARGAWCVVRGAWCVARGAWCVARDKWQGCRTW